MIEIGKYQTLELSREMPFGCYLTDGEEEILLPAKYVPEFSKPGDELEVFCYLDHEQRPVATTQRPEITRDTFGVLKVAEMTEFGAFMDWGLDKHLLVPFREQPTRMKEGESYVVFCYLDPKSRRLVASARIDRFIDNSELTLKPGEQVEILCYRETDLGYEVVVNEAYKGLVFRNQVHGPFGAGTRRSAFVKEIRKDRKLDIVLEPLGHRKLEPAARKIYLALQESGGTLPLHDKSDPEAINQVLQMSKKLFKKGIGILYKQGKIDIEETGIRLRT